MLLLVHAIFAQMHVIQVITVLPLPKFFFNRNMLPIGTFEDFTRSEQFFDIAYYVTQVVMSELKQSYEDFVEQE